MPVLWIDAKATAFSSLCLRCFLWFLWILNLHLSSSIAFNCHTRINTVAQICTEYVSFAYSQINLQTVYTRISTRTGLRRLKNFHFFSEKQFQHNQITQTEVEFNPLSICAHRNQRTSRKSTQTKRKGPTFPLCGQYTEEPRRKVRISSEDKETNQCRLQCSAEHCQQKEANFAERAKRREKKKFLQFQPKQTNSAEVNFHFSHSTSDYPEHRRRGIDEQFNTLSNCAN